MNWKVGSVSRLAVGAILVAALLGGTVATAYAAQGALPGSTLHSVKTGLERAQLALSVGEAADARLQLQFAEKRLEELAGLIEAGRFNELADVGAAFEAHIQAAIEGLGSIAQSDPSQAQELATAVTAALSRYASILTGLAASVPTEAQAPLLRALELSTQGVGSEGEDVNTNESGDLNENECENGDANETDDGAANENKDLNESNSNDLSQNENDDLNENDHEDANEKDQVDANENDQENAAENDQADANEHASTDVTQSCDPSVIESEAGD